MSAKLNVFLSMGLIILMLLTIGVGGYYIKRANDTVDETKKLILIGQEKGNIRANLTLGAVGDVIADLRQTENNILGNLTDHRIVSNETRDTIIESVNNNNILLEQLLDKSFDVSGNIASGY